MKITVTVTVEHQKDTCSTSIQREMTSPAMAVYEVVDKLSKQFQETTTELIEENAKYWVEAFGEEENDGN